MKRNVRVPATIVLGLVVYFLTAFPTKAAAATIVGHGGNAGDVELMVTVKQVQETVGVLQNSEDQELCTCIGAFMHHPICDSLKSLNEDQQKFCSKFLIKQSQEIHNLLNQDRIKFEFTHDPIEVKENGRVRAADAVALTAENRIMLNQQRFLDLSPADRIFLLTHELLHFTTWNGHAVVDDSALGPFLGNDGGRAAINAAAAATAQAANNDGRIKRYNGVLRRAKSWKKNWIDFAVASESLPKTSSSFGMDSLTGVQLRFRHYFGDWGIIASFQNGQATKTVAGSIASTEMMTRFGAGITYRIFPFSDPMTYWGQSHASFYALIESAMNSYSVNDGFVSNQSQAQTLAGEAGASYMIPVAWGLWGYGGASYVYHPYQYSSPNLSYGASNTSVYLGVSYGF